MKCLLISADFPPIIGGESVFYYNLFRLLPSKKVVILAPKVRGSSPFDKRQNFQIYRLKGLLFPSLIGKLIKVLLFWYHTAKLIKAEKIELIHCGQLFTTGLIGFLVKKCFNIPYFLYVYGTEFQVHKKIGLLKSFWIKVLKEAAYVITVSDFAKKEYLGMGVDAKRLITVYPGVDVKLFRPNLDCSKIVERYKLRDKKVILSVSRLEKDKGEDMVIRALPEVIKKTDNLVYLVVGAGSQKVVLKKLVDKFHLKDRVVFTGAMPNGILPQIFNACDVFIRATREEKGHMEGFGIVYLEANACGKTVIGGRTGGAVEAIIHNQTGLLINPKSQQEIARSLIKLLSDRALREKLGGNGRKRVIEKFNWENSAQSLLKLIERTVIK